MARPIKFRAKRLDNGEWVYGNYVNYVVSAIIKKGSIEHSVDPETVCQLTGQKDDFDKDIFEGDIVDNDDGQLQVVKWLVWDDEQGYMLNMDNSLKIVGNIWDNPELEYYEHIDTYNPKIIK